MAKRVNTSVFSQTTSIYVYVLVIQIVHRYFLQYLIEGEAGVFEAENWTTKKLSALFSYCSFSPVFLFTLLLYFFLTPVYSPFSCPFFFLFLPPPYLSHNLLFPHSSFFSISMLFPLLLYSPSSSPLTTFLPTCSFLSSFSPHPHSLLPPPLSALSPHHRPVYLT